MEKGVKSNLVLEGKNFSFKRDLVELPSGRTTVRDIVLHPGAVGILPFTDEGEIVLVEQYRYAAGKKLLEIPAGTIEEGEGVEACVLRELAEETGYLASKIEKIITCYTSPGYSSELLHVYLAEDLTETEPHTEEDEFLNVVKMKHEKVYEMIRMNKIIDAKTILALLYFKQFL